MKWTEWLAGARNRGGVFALLLMVIAAYYLRMLRGYSAPFMVPDEFGYSVIAAYLAGHDWSNVTQGLPWYSYGYSLLLAPIYMLVKPTGWYHAAQFLNVLLVIVAGVLANAFLRKFVTNKVDRYMAVAAVLLYPSLVFYVHFTWSELLIAVLPWLTAIQVARMGRADSGYLDAVLYAVLLASCYYIHSRLIVLCIAGLVVLGYQVWMDGRRIRALVCVAVFALTMILGNVLKNYFIAYVYNGDVGGVQDSLVKMMLELGKRFNQPSALMTMLEAAAGQFAYLLIATLGLLVPGVWAMLTRTKQCHVQGEVGASSALMFLLLALLGGYALVAISMGTGPLYAHHVFYGRYSDPLVLPVMAFGLVCCLERPRAVFKFAAISLALAVLAVPMAMHLVAKLPQVTYWTAIVGLFPYRTPSWQLDTGHLLWGFALVTVVLALSFRWWPRFAGVLVCGALLAAGVGITRIHQSGASGHEFQWRSRLDQPRQPFRGKIILNIDDGDPQFLRTQARMINPDATLVISRPGDSVRRSQQFEDHMVLRQSSSGLEHLYCDFDDTTEVPEPAKCTKIDAQTLKAKVHLDLGDPRKQLSFRHAFMHAKAYYVVSTLPYLRTLWPYLGSHRVTLRYATQSGFPTVVNLKGFVTRPGEPTWLGDRSAQLFVPAGEASGLIKVQATVRGYDGNPLPPGQYSFHVVVSYPDGYDWSTHATIPMSIH